MMRADEATNPVDDARFRADLETLSRTLVTAQRAIRAHQITTAQNNEDADPRPDNARSAS